MGTAIVLGATAASAQDISTTQVAPSTTTSTGASVTDTSGPTDHSVVVGHLGLRYFGSADVAALGFNNGMIVRGGSRSIHTVGMRYWLNGSLGIEAGLGIGFSSGSTTVTSQTGGMQTQTQSDQPNFFGIGLQVGLPIMVAEAKHLAIHVDPYLFFRYGTSGITTGSGDSTRDNSLNAIQFGLGANAVAELQFGFLGLPQLGLQAQFGFGLSYANESTTSVQLRNNDTETGSQSGFGIGTTIGPNYGLAEIISGSLSAVWYFGGTPGR
ncbi:MAG: hypothetical protein Q8S73_28190 [Deltaproteobacteria bacterium]|nr:hypothetical protein [Myxococcales bacterium]MDP3218019.1 hypothetical protein [Deltaproteobacteria bacterium]